MRFSSVAGRSSRAAGPNPPLSFLVRAASRFSTLGLAVNGKLNRTEAVAAAAWDSPDYLREVLAAFEGDLSAAADDLRKVIAKMQAVKEQFIKDSR